MFNFKQKLFWGVLLGSLVVICFSASCASKAVNADDPDALYNHAEEAYQDEDYLVALDTFREVKNRFPYSQKAVEAELRIADTYFAQEAYIEAEAAYEVFKELHPTHAKADYVQYQIGMSYFHQIPDDIARDLSAALQALEAFKELETDYPSSKYTKQALSKAKETRLKLAQHERYVANFYYQRRH